MGTRKWEVVDGKFIDGGGGVTMSCHHQTKGACGGCYARLVTALNEINDRQCECKAGASGFANEVLTACKAEGEALK